MSRAAVNDQMRKCPKCAALTRGVTHATLGVVCGLCWHPLVPAKRKKGMPKKRAKARRPALPVNPPYADPTHRALTVRQALQQALEAADGRDFEEFKDELRKLEKRLSGDDLVELADVTFLRSDPGYPLGKGYPPGRVVREGSHRQAWQTVVRADPCSYCGRPVGGTVDHIEPRSTGGRDVWLNYAGACSACYGSKGHEKLLSWMLRRARSAGSLAAAASGNVVDTRPKEKV